MVASAGGRHTKIAGAIIPETNSALSKAGSLQGHPEIPGTIFPEKESIEHA